MSHPKRCMEATPRGRPTGPRAPWPAWHRRGRVRRGTGTGRSRTAPHRLDAARRGRTRWLRSRLRGRGTCGTAVQCEAARVGSPAIGPYRRGRGSQSQPGAVDHRPASEPCDPHPIQARMKDGKSVDAWAYLWIRKSPACSRIGAVHHSYRTKRRLQIYNSQFVREFRAIIAASPKQAAMAPCWPVRRG